jgi:hypothetical protein
MMHVAPSRDCASLMHRAGISLEMLTRAVNNRQHGLAKDELNRMLVVHWLNSKSAIFVDCSVTKYHHKLRKIRQVAPQIAIRITNALPAGSLSPESPISEVLSIVAESFGFKISWHPDEDEDAAWVYEGPWDGRIRTFENTSGHSVFLSGSFSPDLKKCALVWSLDSGKYLGWFVKNLAAFVQASMSFQSPLEFIKAQKTLLEELFPNGWFVNEQRKHSLHPAYIRWQRCRDLIAGNGRVQLPRDIETINAILSALCDNLSLIQATRGSFDAQKLGDLANYGDEAVQKRLRAVIKDHGQFLDVLVELACAGSHVSRSHEVKATEEKGMPDLELTIPGWPLPIQAECKCVKNSRFKDAIEKANAQIKRGRQRSGSDKPCYGLVYLDVSQRSVDPASYLNDSLPKEIAPIQVEVQRCLSGLQYTSASGVVLLWKDHTILKMNDGGAHCCPVVTSSKMD